ncbi:hypothetical protein RhiirA4_478045 [Rhizophagus irregularis]|uniref:Uncharacterized protein n=1 Tax=Rhizophagus irregularis TaxID=588596 RepID=A0A2I1HE94_9GLOM|nr:hypothetical protein RhiirA4_478045 [Rhizophagus irregularis]
MKFAKECKDKKLRSFSLYKTKKELSEVLRKYGIDSNKITKILLFELESVKIDDEDEELKQCITEIKYMQSKIDSLRQRITELEFRNAEPIKQMMEENNRYDARLETRILKLEQDQSERESKKNRKFRNRCIQIAKEILNEEPIIKYHPPFLNGLELDAFFQKC